MFSGRNRPAGSTQIATRRYIGGGPVCYRLREADAVSKKNDARKKSAGEVKGTAIPGVTRLRRLCPTKDGMRRGRHA